MKKSNVFKSNEKIVIGKPVIEQMDEYTIYKVYITIKDEKKELWYKVKKEYGRFFLTQRCDGILVASILYALKNKLDIECEIPVSEKLYFQLKDQLIPFLCNGDSELLPIDIKCDVDSNDYNVESNVGTGISCGVDSLGTILQYSNDTENFEINMLTLYNSGYYGEKNESSENYKKYINQSEEFASKNNYKILTVDSNISSIFKYPFTSAHTYLTCSTTLLFQSLFKTYYYASGFSSSDIKYSNKDSAYYDIFLLDCISTEGLKFYSGQSGVPRIEKVGIIAENESIKQHLYVCIAGNPPYNCTKCEKCIRTVLEADALGKLEKFEKVFDLKSYKKYRVFYIAYALRNQKNIFYKDICRYMKKTDKKTWFLAHFFYLVPSPLDLRKNKTIAKIVKMIKKR